MTENEILSVLKTVEWSGWKWEKYKYDKSQAERCCPVCNGTWYHPNESNEYLVTKHADGCGLAEMIEVVDV